MHETMLHIEHLTPIGSISPRIYGHFAEHLGRCCYDGLWGNSGLRQNVVDVLRRMPVPLLRWPGGCYADHYHWRDGIGPHDQRPRRLGMSCGRMVEDDNRIGTHEFLELCRLLDAEPYLAGNVSTGSPQELCDWVEYCNSAFDTDLTRMRRANGASEPFKVRLWGIGNESWGCGGNYEAKEYANIYRPFATMVKEVDPQSELVMVGFDDTWNAAVLKAMQRHPALINHLSIHHYYGKGGDAAEFTEAEYYAQLAEAATTEHFVARTAALIAEVFGASHFVGVALDEWGAWHPETLILDEQTRQQHAFEQIGTLRDALTVGVVLEGFHRQCRVLSMANLAQIVNVLHAPLLTEGELAWATPTYYALQLHAPHIGATALPVHGTDAVTLPDGTSAVSGTASIKDGRLAVTVLNLDIDQDAVVRIAPGTAWGSAECQLLTANSPRAYNSAQQPNNVTLQPLAVTFEGATVIIELPAHSMATMVLS